MCNVEARSKKTLEEMDVIDDFLFTEIMTDEENGKEVCRIILSLVLKREIGEINYTAQKVVPGISERSHGIRMDAYITEDLSKEDTGSIGKSIKANVTDENTEKLDDIVHKTKAKKGVGVRFMKSWEREKELREEGRKEGKEEERINTEAERKRANDAEERADKAEAELEKYRKKYGILA